VNEDVKGELGEDILGGRSHNIWRWHKNLE